MAFDISHPISSICLCSDVYHSPLLRPLNAQLLIIISLLPMVVTYSRWKELLVQVLLISIPRISSVVRVLYNIYTSSSTSTNTTKPISVFIVGNKSLLYDSIAQASSYPLLPPHMCAEKHFDISTLFTFLNLIFFIYYHFRHVTATIRRFYRSRYTIGRINLLFKKPRFIGFPFKWVNHIWILHHRILSLVALVPQRYKRLYQDYY